MEHEIHVPDAQGFIPYIPNYGDRRCEKSRFIRECGVVCNMPEGVEQAWVRVHDLNGRLVTERRIAGGAGIVELDLSGVVAGVYAAELNLDAVRTGQVKLVVQ